MARHVNVALVLINVLVFQIVCLSPLLKVIYPSAYMDDLYRPPSDRPFNSKKIGSFLPDNVMDWHLMNPIAIPPGSPPNLPSIRTTAQDDGNVDQHRKIYGGTGDKKHLGGFTELDLAGISPTLWTRMIQTYGVRSLLDVGCGRGTSSRWFMEHGADVLCVEGSHDAIEKSFLPPAAIVEHDYSRGPWWPRTTYDAAWSVEFLEHVSRQYHYNYISTLRKAALIFVTSSRWGTCISSACMLVCVWYRVQYSCAVSHLSHITHPRRLAPCRDPPGRLVDSKIRNVRLPLFRNAHQTVQSLGRVGL
jgi:hypothetical protein